MFWWEKAALATRAGKTRRFGFITTNSLRQTFNRQVLEPHLSDPKTPLSLVFAIPDHPWVDAGEGAAVRIAMTVAAPGNAPGRLFTVTTEKKGDEANEGRSIELSGQVGRIFTDLRIGADVAASRPLLSNGRLSSNGMMLAGQGFIVSKPELGALGLGRRPGLEDFVGPYIKGGELNNTARGQWVLDFYGLNESELKAQFPEAYQHLHDRVFPERAANNDRAFREKWWVFGRPRTELRPALKNVQRFIATTETSKHRMFTFLPKDTRPDHMLIAIAIDDAAALSILSSRFHVIWALTAGGRLGFGNDPRYNKSRCFDPFPFPDATDDQKARLRLMGEELDAHRKAQQAAHPKLTLTAMYNVLEKLRAGQKIEGKDKETYDQGLVGILRTIHDRIDAELAAAYGWPVNLSDDDILHRLVALNRARTAEEASGLIRWLRPEYQNPAGHAAIAQGTQAELDVGPTDTTAKTPWPKNLPDQIAAVHAALSDMGEATTDQIARRFTRAQSRSVQTLLESLTALGQARIIEGGRFAA